MKKLALVIFCMSLLSADCIRGIPSHVEVRHREPEGIGYTTGYTTLQGFITPNWQRHFQPFVDVRGHMFNDGRTATNIGLGGRFAPGDNWIFGLNSYYDFRDAKRLRAHQIGVGLEALSRHVDFRLNGYIPTHTNASTTPLVADTDGDLLIAKRRATAALANVMLEMGVPMHAGPVDIYGSLGPYYLVKRHVGASRCGGTMGGIGRLSLRVYDGIDIGGEVSYDKEFHTRANGYLSLSFPYGSNTITRKGSRWKQWYNSECDGKANLQRRMTQGVQRQEIIPFCDKKEKFPQDGSSSFLLLPDCFFVDSDAAAGGDGSFENPFQDLATALATVPAGSCVYVFDRGVAYALDPIPGTLMPDNVTLVGSGVDYTFGSVFFPAQTPNFPTITGALQTSTQSTITGLSFSGITSSIRVTPFAPVINLLITNNRFVNSATYNFVAPAASGSTLFFMNNFIDGPIGSFVIVQNFDTVTFDGNRIQRKQTFFNTNGRLVYQNNTIDSPTTQSFPITILGGDMIVQNNEFNIDTTVISAGAGNTGNFIVINNTITQLGGTGVEIALQTTGTIDFRNNISSDDYIFGGGPLGTNCYRITGNTGPLIQLGVTAGNIINVDGAPIADNPAVISVTTPGAGTVNTSTGCF